MHLREDSIFWKALRALALAVFAALGAATCAAVAFAVAIVAENLSRDRVRAALDVSGHDWATVDSDGTLVVLAGTAPGEGAKFEAFTVARAFASERRIVDLMETPGGEALSPREPGIEILRDGDGVTLIGVVPVSADRHALLNRISRAGSGKPLRDLLQATEFPATAEWNRAMAFALEALEAFPISGISVSADLVRIAAVAESQDARDRLERRLQGLAPGDIPVELDIAAPRPVVSPYVLDIEIENGATRMASCWAETRADRDRVLEAARAAGAGDGASCGIGLGAPAPSWADAAVAAIGALAELGSGSVALEDGAVKLVAFAGADPDQYEKVAKRLESRLPHAFVFRGSAPPEPEASEQRPPEFRARLNPDRSIELSGRIDDEVKQELVANYTRARFGSDNVESGASDLGANTAGTQPLPGNWSVRVLAGIEALTLLRDGTLVVRPDELEIAGTSEMENARRQMSEILRARLGASARPSLKIAFEEPAPEYVEEPPDFEICLARIRATQDRKKIAFDPGSTVVAAASLSVIGEIADILKECPDMPLEIQGHTDSQGREEMNMRLSQDRAEAVLVSLQLRRVLTRGFMAVGMGESAPIADNDSEEGREKNRRIEFHLIGVQGDVAADDPDSPVAPELQDADPELASQGEGAGEAGTDGEDGATKPILRPGAGQGGGGGESAANVARTAEGSQGESASSEAGGSGTRESGPGATGPSPDEGEELE